MFIGSALDIGVAYDDSGDWMLFVSTSAGGEIDPSKVPHLATGVDTQKLAELVNNREKDVAKAIEIIKPLAELGDEKVKSNLQWYLDHPN